MELMHTEVKAAHQESQEQLQPKVQVVMMQITPLMLLEVEAVILL